MSPAAFCVSHDRGRSASFRDRPRLSSFCRLPDRLLVAASSAIARMPGCWATGSSWATSGGMWSPARYGNLSMWLLFISTSRSRMYCVAISDVNGQCVCQYDLAMADGPTPCRLPDHELGRTDSVVPEVPPDLLHELLLRPPRQASFLGHGRLLVWTAVLGYRLVQDEATLQNL